ncbi:MAG: MYXO-CTERM sorting domain-containing protein [Deltaproteobacteria bacterium]|nr:MYXO-CTERM sorting domain-containing protein [Deltaproteobacteria bacterium]
MASPGTTPAARARPARRRGRDGPIDTFGFEDEGGEEGCGCTTESRGGGALLGLFGLVLLGSIRRRRS